MKIKIKSKTLDEILKKLGIVVSVLVFTSPILAACGFWVWAIVYVPACLGVDWLLKHIEIVEE